MILPNPIWMGKSKIDVHQTTNQPTIRILTPHAHGGASTQLGPSAGALGSSAGCPRATQHPGPCTSATSGGYPGWLARGIGNRYLYYICIFGYLYMYLHILNPYQLDYLNYVILYNTGILTVNGNGQQKPRRRNDNRLASQILINVHSQLLGCTSK